MVAQVICFPASHCVAAFALDSVDSTGVEAELRQIYAEALQATGYKPRCALCGSRILLYGARNAFFACAADALDEMRRIADEGVRMRGVWEERN